MNEDEIKNLKDENYKLRHIVSDSAAALCTGAFISPTCSIEYMQGLPKEIASVVTELRNKIGEEK